MKAMCKTPASPAPLAIHAQAGPGRRQPEPAAREQRGESGRPGCQGRSPAHPALAGASASVPPAVYTAINAPGSPLDQQTQGAWGRHFGYGLGEVRIHNDSAASKAATSLRAAAFTVGNHIVFGAQRYAPDSLPGRLLLHHELQHVAQQRTASPAPSLMVDPPYSPHEQQARDTLHPRVEALPVQRVQCASEQPEFTLGSGSDAVGRRVFGSSAWPFLKAVLEGFVGGLQTDAKSDRAGAATSHLQKLLLPWNALKFAGGYFLGLLLGLLSPVTDLIKGIIGIAKLAVSALTWLAKWSPVGIAVSPARQQKIARLLQTFADLSAEFGKTLSDFISDPKSALEKFTGFIKHLMELALGKARELGAKAAHSLSGSILSQLEQGFFDLGRSVGEVVGALVAQILLLVFSGAIANLVSKGAAFLGKAVEFVAGKAVAVFEWVKGFFSEVLGVLRNAVKGALKFFAGLLNKAIEAFDALLALFSESAALDTAGERVAAGVGRGVSGPLPNVMESRMVSATRTAPAKVADLPPAKIHSSNVPHAAPQNLPGTVLKTNEAFVAERAAAKQVLQAKPLIPESQVKPSKLGTRRAFARRIAAEEEHPLKSVLNAKGRLKQTTAKGITEFDWLEDPTFIEWGHVTSAKVGGNSTVLMSAYKNRTLSATIEHASKGGYIEIEEALEIGNYLVDKDLALDLLGYGRLTLADIKKARRVHLGR